MECLKRTLRTETDELVIGTGTATGDPIEANAIESVFAKERSPDQPLFLCVTIPSQHLSAYNLVLELKLTSNIRGSIKANIGHLEGSSGPAGVVKAVMMLERGMIPPQALFKTLNPAIDAARDNIKVPIFSRGMMVYNNGTLLIDAILVYQIPTVNTPWPETGLRRISVNSFGFGGANAHVVLDDAPHYMRTHNMHGFYRSIKHLESSQCELEGSVETSADEIQCTTGSAVTNGTINGAVNGAVNGNTNGTVNGHHGFISTPRLLIWSAADESATKRMLQKYSHYYSTRIIGSRLRLDQLAYTLAARRSIMPWRSFAVVEASNDIPDPGAKSESLLELGISLPTEKPLRVNSVKTDVAFVFTGQGAQYAGMGLELMRYTIFSQSLRRSDEIFGSLGSEWSLVGESEAVTKFNRAG